MLGTSDLMTTKQITFMHFFPGGCTSKHETTEKSARTDTLNGTQVPLIITQLMALETTISVILCNTKLGSTPVVKVVVYTNSVKISCTIVGEEVGIDIDDGGTLGTADGVELSIDVGNKDGKRLGFNDGTRLGLSLGITEGNDDGIILGPDDGSCDGVTLGTPDGVKLGTEVG